MRPVRPRLLPPLLLVLALAVPAPAGAARSITPLPPTWREGLNVTAFWWQDLSGPRFRTWLGRARSSARAREVTFVIPWFQYFSDRNRSDHLNATEIHRSPGDARTCRRIGSSFTRCKTPSDAAVAAAVRRARSLGLRVVLRPQLEVGRNARTATDRDLVQKGPGEKRAWFDSYKRFLSAYARIARDTGAEGLVIGTGLSGMTDGEDDRAEWRAIIAELRSGALMGDGRGYRGELTYTAAWDSIVEDAKDPEQHLFFWDALDLVSISAEFPLLAEPPDPTIGALTAAWATSTTGLPAGPAQLVRNIQAEYDKPVGLSLGYLSRTGTAAFPEKSDFDQQQAGGVVRESAQARPVRAAFDVWTPIAYDGGWFRGISWNEWPASGRGGVKDGSFSVQGKAAEVEICLRHAGVFTPRCRRSSLRR